VNFKIFTASAAAAVFFLQKSAAAAAEPLGLHLYSSYYIEEEL
jgi:hypothetical protein